MRLQRRKCPGRCGSVRDAGDRFNHMLSNAPQRQVACSFLISSRVLTSNFSEILRRSAENTMHALVRTVFSRLHSLDPAAEEAKIASYEEDMQEGEIKMTVSTTELAAQDVPDVGQENDTPQELTIEIPEPEEVAAPTPSTLPRSECVSTYISLSFQY